MFVKIIIETPFKGAKTRVSCVNVVPSAVRICNDEYINRRGMCITRRYPIPCKVEYIFNESENQIEAINTLMYEGKTATQ